LPKLNGLSYFETVILNINIDLSHVKGTVILFVTISISLQKKLNQKLSSEVSFQISWFSVWCWSFSPEYLASRNLERGTLLRSPGTRPSGTSTSAAGSVYLETRTSGSAKLWKLNANLILPLPSLLTVFSFQYFKKKSGINRTDAKYKSTHTKTR